MIKNLQLNNFKGIESVTLNDLKRINVIAGRNGRGKTSILDAIFIFNDIISPDILLKPIYFRGGTPILNENDLFLSYFYSFDSSRTVSIDMVNENGVKYQVSMNVESRKNKATENFNVISKDSFEKSKVSLTSEDSEYALKIKLKNINSKQLIVESEHVIVGTQINAKLTRHSSNYSNDPTTYITTSNKINNVNTLSVIGELSKRKNKEDLIKNLAVINKKICGVEIVLSNDQPEIYVDVGHKRLVDVTSLGEGVGKLLTIFAVSFFVKNGIILIDEIENGIHYSLLPEIFNKLLELAKSNNNQIFITTHSADVIRVLGDMYEKNELIDKDISYARIGYSENQNKTIVSMFTLNEIKMSNDENWEIR